VKAAAMRESGLEWKEIAAALYEQPRRDKVLVFDNPYGPGPHKPRVFADGLAIPLGLLPYKDGAYVQHGSDILFLRDSELRQQEQ